MCSKEVISKPQKLFPKLLTSIFGLCLGLFCFEYFGTLFLKSKISKDYYATVDHYPKPYEKGFNEDGIRTYKNCPITSFTSDTFNIIFLGDSFTMGLLAEQGSGDIAFPFQVNRMLEARGVSPTTRVANFGWTSSSPILDYHRLILIGRKYHPRLVILCLDIGDFYDDLSYKILLEDKNAFSPTRYLMNRSGLMPRWIRIKSYFGVKQDLPEDHFFIVNQDLAKSEKYLGEIENNILLIYQFCRDELKVPFILILLPRNIQYSKDESPHDSLMLNGAYKPMGPYVFEPIVWLKRFKKAVPFPAFSLLEDFKEADVFPTCYQNDPHYNKKGHHIAAEAICKILRRLSHAGFMNLKFAREKYSGV